MTMELHAVMPPDVERLWNERQDPVMRQNPAGRGKILSGPRPNCQTNPV
jgi:hypothetical protein